MTAKTTTLYARLPVEVKAAVDAWADEHGKTMAGAVTELLRRALVLSLPDDRTVVYDFRVEVSSSGVTGSVIRHPQVSPGTPEDR